MDLAIALGRPLEAVSASVTGVNHFPVLTSLEVDGADGFDLLRKLVDEVGGLDSLRPAPGPARGRAVLQARLRPSATCSSSPCSTAGARFPAAGDRHIAEFVPFALTPESDWGAAYNIGLSPISRREQHQAEYVADVDAWLAGTKDLQTWQSGELPSPMIQAMLTGEPFEAPVNIPNAGQAVGLPPDVVLESICVIDGDGIRGRDRSVLPASLRRDRAPPRRHPGAHRRGGAAGRPHAGRGGLRPRPAGGTGRPARTRRPWSTSSWPARRSGCPSSRSAGRDVWEEHACASDSSGSGAMGLPMAGHLVAAGPRRHRRLA